MRKTTSQQLIDSLGYQENQVGKPVVAGIAIDQAQQLKTLYDVPKGQVFLVTKIVVQIDPMTHLAGHQASPSIIEMYQGVQLYDPAGTPREQIRFRGFHRNKTIFSGGTGTPDFRSSQPGDVIVWDLKYPAVVPGGWSIRKPTGLFAFGWGNSTAVYGVVVSESEARTLGYNVSNSTTASERQYGWQASDGDTSATVVVAARTGKSIHVLDIHVRLQPMTYASNSLTLQQSDGQQIFRAVNDNPAEGVTQAFSPGWYLKAGESLDIISDIATGNSVNVTYEYVDETEVPGDVWFATVNPNVPTPGLGTFGSDLLENLVLKASTQVTLYYPRHATTKTSPLKGFQHMVKGYSITIQKEVSGAVSTDLTPQTMLCISTGSSAGGVEILAGSLLQSNYQISPVFSATAHDQCTWGVVDGLNIPCKPDDGSLWINTVGFETAVATPTSGTNGIRAWAVNLWGRTATAQFTERTNPGTQ